MPPPGPNARRRTKGDTSPTAAAAAAPAAAHSGISPPSFGKVLEQVGDYSLRRKVGQGHFGNVHMATHGPSGKVVAVKNIEKARLGPSEIHLVEREAYIMKIMRHPNIIRFVVDVHSTHTHTHTQHRRRRSSGVGHMQMTIAQISAGTSRVHQKKMTFRTRKVLFKTSGVKLQRICHCSSTQTNNKQQQHARNSRSRSVCSCLRQQR